MMPKIVALDFDGVICNGLPEYFLTTQKTYELIWKEQPLNNEFAPIFYRLRPVIETGWEMPVLMRALVLGIAETEILSNWLSIRDRITDSERLNISEIAQQLDLVRDRWITNNLEEWLALHQFYPGIIQRLKEISHSETKLYIITTKEGRFVKQLLAKEGVNLPPAAIIGKESQRPKAETLRLILQDNSVAAAQIWFVEDRLKTLLSVQKQTDLAGISLFLANWGYNTETERDSLPANSHINLLSLRQFNQDFSTWQQPNQ